MAIVWLTKLPVAITSVSEDCKQNDIEEIWVDSSCESKIICDMITTEQHTAIPIIVLILYYLFYDYRHEFHMNYVQLALNMSVIITMSDYR